MTAERVSYLDLLDRLCRREGWAPLLTAQHDPHGFAQPRRTTLNHLTVLDRDRTQPAGRRRITAGDLLRRVDLTAVDGDLEAAAELLVNAIQHTREQAA